MLLNVGELAGPQTSLGSRGWGIAAPHNDMYPHLPNVLSPSSLPMYKKKKRCTVGKIKPFFGFQVRESPAPLNVRVACRAGEEACVS